MLKEFDPMDEKESVSEFFMASIEVNTPINAIIPMAMISAVKNVRSLFPTMDCSASLTFST